NTLSAGTPRLRFIDLVDEVKIAVPQAPEQPEGQVSEPAEQAAEATEVVDATAAPTDEAEENPAEAAAETTTGEAEAEAVAEAPAEEPKPEEPQRAFQKGELTRFGDVQFQNRRSSFGVAFGATDIDGVYYAVLRPDVNIHSGPFSLGLGAPLRFEVANTNNVDPQDPANIVSSLFSDFGRFRSEDWDQVEDFLRPLRYLTWGRKEDRLYLDVNRIRAVSIGHGQLVRRYSPTIDIDEDNLFAQVNGYTDIGGFELMAGPFPVPRLVGGLVFLKPLGLFLDDYMSKSLSIGASWVTDLNVPTVLTTESAPSDGRTLLAVDDAGNFDYTNKGAFTGDMVHGFGVDAEVKLVKWEFIDLKTYVDYSQLLFPGSEAGGFSSFSDGGFTAGTLLRLSFGETPVRDFDEEDDLTRAGQKPREMRATHALRLRMEGRAFGPQYLPSYFDSLYEADKLQFGFGSTPLSLRASLPTKVAYLASQAGQPWRFGTYLEGSYAFVDWFGFTAVYEDAVDTEGNAVPAARNFALHAETGKALSILQLFATYHYRHFEDASKLLQVATDNELIYLGGRLQLLPILFVNVGAQRAFRTGFLDDDLPDQRRVLTGAPEGSEKFRFSSIGLQNTWVGAIDVELGWQF
ncbi:MAG: hypothetical protein ACO3JL_05450, partial [Myxococcota bacterium]